MQPHPSLARIEKLYMCYQNELHTIMPNFSQELLNILNFKSKKKNYKSNPTPHFSEEFSRPMNIVSKKEEEKAFDIITENMTTTKIKNKNSKKMQCSDCFEFHVMESRYCQECNETHSGCCDILLE